VDEDENNRDICWHYFTSMFLRVFLIRVLSLLPGYSSVGVSVRLNLLLSELSMFSVTAYFDYCGRVNQ